MNKRFYPRKEDAVRGSASLMMILFVFWYLWKVWKLQCKRYNLLGDLCYLKKKSSDNQLRNYFISLDLKEPVLLSQWSCLNSLVFSNIWMFHLIITKPLPVKMIYCQRNWWMEFDYGVDSSHLSLWSKVSCSWCTRIIKMLDTICVAKVAADLPTLLSSWKSNNWISGQGLASLVSR